MTVYRLTGVEEVAKRGDEPGPDPIVHIDVDPAILKTYEGLYELVPTFQIRVTLEGKTLRTQATDQPSFTLAAESTERFLVEGVPAAVSFQKEDGKVVAMILHQGDRDQTLRKIE